VAENLSVEAPDFDEIVKEAGDSTADAARLLWFVLNNEIATSRRGLRTATERIEPKVRTAAPTGAENNYATEGASVLYFTGATSFTLSGVRAPEPGNSRLIILYNSGTGTITVANQSASSIAENRFQNSTNADRSLAQHRGMFFIYLGSRWREVVF
jgi:hypothetical protein